MSEQACCAEFFADDPSCTCTCPRCRPQMTPHSNEDVSELVRRTTRLFHNIVPYRIGSRVRVSQGYRFAADWPGTYIIVGMTWEYQRGDGYGINIAIASEDEIVSRLGSTDGWKPEDLLPSTAAEAGGEGVSNDSNMRRCSACLKVFKSRQGADDHIRQKHAGNATRIAAGPGPKHDDHESMADIFVQAQINRAMGEPNEDWIEDMLP